MWARVNREVHHIGVLIKIRIPYPSKQDAQGPHANVQKSEKICDPHPTLRAGHPKVTLGLRKAAANRHARARKRAFLTFLEAIAYSPTASAGSVE
jgi:hypothetical protein